MEFSAKMNKGVCEATVEGELTIYHAIDLKNKLLECIDGADEIVLNMSNVSELDTSCFQLLMQAKQTCDEQEKVFKLVMQSPAVMEVLDLYKMGHFFEQPAETV